MNIYERIAYHIAGLWLVLNTTFQGLFDFLDAGKIIRRLAFFFMLYITYKAYFFCFQVAEASSWDAATIGATFSILTPVSLLQAAVFKFYNSGRTSEKSKETSVVEVDEVRINGKPYINPK